MGNVRCIAILGRQGSGKGVQAARLAERLGFDHVSTGDLLRQAIAAGTPLGRAVEDLVVTGALVADDVVTGVVAESLALAWAEGRGVVLDGFPRTVAQAERLEGLLAPDGIDAVIHLDVPRAVAVDRILGRRVCRLCGATTGTTTCVRCGGPMTARADDVHAAVGRRMSEHAAAIGPLLEWYADAGVLVNVDGLGDPDVIEGRIWQALAPDRLAAAAAG